jgi:outer membrane receptor protein involved in Fe transport
VGYHSGISDYLLKSDFDFKPNTNHDVRFGLNFISHQFRPDVISAKERTTGNIDHDYDPDFEPFDFSVNNKPVPGNELSLYAEDDWLLSSMFRVNVGARYSTFLVQKRFYHSIQPRAAVRAMLSSNLSVKAGYSYMSQYIHLLSNSSISLPTDLWVPVTKRIAPMNTHQISVGTFYNLKKTIDFSAEIYYKTMNNLLEYKDGSSFFGVSTGWEDKVNVGRGWSYGLELMVQKSVGKTTGWVAYTWAKSERLFDRVGQEVNFGRVFPAKFDRRHDISITLSHKFSTKIDMGATWVFSTGNAASLALQNYNPGTVPDAGNRYWYDDSMHYYSSRNNYRMPSYHRLDLGINFHKKKKHGTRTWNISIYNVYNQQNPFVIYEGTKGEYVNNNGNWRSHKVLKQLSIFPIIPSVSYIYAF